MVTLKKIATRLKLVDMQVNRIQNEVDGDEIRPYFLKQLDEIEKELDENYLKCAWGWDIDKQMALIETFCFEYLNETNTEVNDGEFEELRSFIRYLFDKYIKID